MAATPEQIAAAKDAWFMGAERAARGLTEKEKAQARLDARIDASWDRWAVMERWLFERAPAWRMPAGNTCAFAVEGALWLRDHRPNDDVDEFLADVQHYRNERLDRLGEHMADFKTESWL